MGLVYLQHCIFISVIMWLGEFMVLFVSHIVYHVSHLKTPLSYQFTSMSKHSNILEMKCSVSPLV